MSEYYVVLKFIRLNTILGYSHYYILFCLTFIYYYNILLTENVVL